MKEGGLAGNDKYSEMKHITVWHLTITYMNITNMSLCLFEMEEMNQNTPKTTVTLLWDQQDAVVRKKASLFFKTSASHLSFRMHVCGGFPFTNVRQGVCCISSSCLLIPAPNGGEKKLPQCENLYLNAVGCWKPFNWLILIYNSLWAGAQSHIAAVGCTRPADNTVVLQWHVH